MKKIFDYFLNFLFPQRCLGCGKENEALCRECLAKIDMPSLPKEGDIYSAADYGDETAKRAIWALKYRGAKNLAEPLAELLNRRLPRTTLGAKGSPWLIVPIPLSKSRFKKRGYNQAELIAKHLFEKLKSKTDFDSTEVRLRCDVLYKIKDTPAQVSVKNKRERLKNLDGAFAVRQLADSETIAGKNIILIDDVSTTGATLREARKTLKLAGAKKVIALVVARG